MSVLDEQVSQTSNVAVVGFSCSEDSLHHDPSTESSGTALKVIKTSYWIMKVNKIVPLSLPS